MEIFWHYKSLSYILTNPNGQEHSRPSSTICVYAFCSFGVRHYMVQSQRMWTKHVSV